MVIFSCFGLSLLLLVVSMSLKTVMIGLRAFLKTAELTFRKVSGVVGQSDDMSDSALEKVKVTAGKAGNAVRGATKVATKSAKTAGKAIKTTAKVGNNVRKVAIRAAKIAIRALRVIINVLHTVVTFLLSLGVIGIVILVVVALFIVAAIAGALLQLNVSPDGVGFTVGGAGAPLISGLNPGSGGFNPGLGNNSGSPSVVVPGNTASLYSACETMAKWYIANIPTYAGTYDNRCVEVWWYDCNIMPFGTMKVGDECGRFAAAYGSYVSGKKIVNEGSLRTIYSGSASWESAGWKYYTMDEIGGVAGLQPGDVMMCADKTDPCSRGGHAEVYLAPNKTFGWGQIQTSFPSNTSTLTNWTCPHGNIYVQAGSGGHRYGRIFRYVGG